jgi:hypothetical protein
MVRTNAARFIRRTPPSQAVPALLRTAEGHADGYVRYRALVLLTGFNDRRTKEIMRDSLTSKNDRMRACAYRYFEWFPDPAMVPDLLKALEQEVAEFVRPALIRALAALGSDANVRPVLVRESGRGEDFFRSAVIEALGDYKADYAIDALAAIAKLDGPLADDAALALGKIGNPRARDILAEIQRTAPPTTQPLVSTALCLLNVECETQERYLTKALTYSEANAGFLELLRAATSGLASLAIAGRSAALDALLTNGVPSRDSARESIAVAVATVALRNTPLMLEVLGRLHPSTDVITLLADGFDMLEEDLEKERFFAFVRRAYWQAPDASATRALMQTLIGVLDF